MVHVKNKKGRRIKYNVRLIESFRCDRQIGETDYELKVITLKSGLDKETLFWTFFHELEHAISEELGLGLTENQVNGLEVGMANLKFT